MEHLCVRGCARGAMVSLGTPLLTDVSVLHAGCCWGHHYSLSILKALYSCTAVVFPVFVSQVCLLYDMYSGVGFCGKDPVSMCCIMGPV